MVGALDLMAERGDVLCYYSSFVVVVARPLIGAIVCCAEPGGGKFEGKARRGET